MGKNHRSPREIRESLDHPIVDADGHLVEYWPELNRFMKAEGIAGGINEFWPTASFDGGRLWAGLAPEERERERTFRGPWWGLPNDARDLATASAPRLLHQRLDELGIDLSLCYPTFGLQMPAQRDDDLRRRSCRAYNRYAAEVLADLRDRLIPIAIIPTVTPDEAIEELDFVVEELGFRAAMIGSFAMRTFNENEPHAFWIDSLGLDSTYDYDPFWQRLVDKKIAPALHSGSMGWSGRRSTSNFSYNHMGNFAGANDASAKSLFFGGVFHRFPDLRVAFLEGGVSWAVQMLIGFVEHWEKRGPAGLKERDPKGLDGELFDQLVRDHSGPITPVTGIGDLMRVSLDTPDVVNDFEAAGITCVQDIVDQVTKQCFFGCEADDPLASLAFDKKRLPEGSRLSPIFSSDIGHWDVAHMDEVLPELEEHLDHGWMDKDEFRDFTCDNAIRLYHDTNPEFFTGTIVEKYASSNR